jgi:hypothetical protein
MKVQRIWASFIGIASATIGILKFISIVDIPISDASIHIITGIIFLLGAWVSKGGYVSRVNFVLGLFYIIAVTGLTADNFRFAIHYGNIEDLNVSAVSELKWEPADAEPSGCYVVQIMPEEGWGFAAGETYSLGIQVRRVSPFTTKSQPVNWDHGQTAIAVTTH